MKKHKPNTRLPKGGKLLNPPITRKIAGWVELIYDASVERNGLTWLRVKGGMGGQGDREDWVLNISSGNCSVHDYHWNGDSFGLDHGSFNNACVQESKRVAASLKTECAELRDKISRAEQAAKLVNKSLKH